jgi:hypothetical protein
MITPAQQRLAKIVGFLYVAQMALAIFAEAFVRGRFITRDAAQTAKNILAGETLFRLSIVADLVVYATVVVLVWGIYVILEPVHRNLALLGVFLRLVENAILAMTTLNAFLALRLAGDTAYLQSIPAPELQSLARLFLGMYSIGLGIGFVFLGLGSAVLSFVWLQSRYIPRGLAMLGIFASLLLTICTLLVFLFPSVSRVGMAYMVPMFFYEVGLGVWLMMKGLREAV